MTDLPEPTLIIFRLGSIGDTVVSLPCFHAIARRYSDHRRVLLTNAPHVARASSAEAILAGTGLVDETIYYPVGDFSPRAGLALLRELRRVRPARMIYLAERLRAAPVFRDLIFFKAAGIPRIVGAPVTGDLRRCRLDPTTSLREYEAERLARTLRGVVKVDFSPASWDLRLSSAEMAKAEQVLGGARQMNVIAIAPGAKIAAKSWGVPNWTGLLDRMAAHYPRVALIIVGAPDERELGDAVSRNWLGPVINACGALTPRETAALLKRCVLMVCHDSGPMHLAGSQLTPCVALFGNRNQPRQWHPFGEGHRVIHESAGIAAISVQRVFDEVRTLWAGSSTAQRVRQASAVG